MLPGDPNVTPLSPPLALQQAYLLESWGAPAEDTTVAFSASEGRVIVMRRGSPDNNLFARISFPPGSVQPAGGDSAVVSIRPRPGLYGIDLVTNATIGDGAEITFSYAIHFVAPAGARDTYGSEYRFERFLGVARLEGDSTLVFADSRRPASDVLAAPLPGPGRYLVAAPRAAPSLRSIIW